MKKQRKKQKAYEKMADIIQHNHLSLSSDLDLHLDSTGKVVKAVGEGFSLKTNIDASGDPKVSWTKVKALVVDGRRVETLFVGEHLLPLKAKDSQDCSKWLPVMIW